MRRHGELRHWRWVVAALPRSWLDIVQPPSLQFTRLLVLNGDFINADWDVTLCFSSRQQCTLGIASTHDGNSCLPPGRQGALSPLRSFCSGLCIATFLMVAVVSYSDSCPQRDWTAECFLLPVVFFPSAPLLSIIWAVGCPVWETGHTALAQHTRWLQRAGDQAIFFSLNCSWSIPFTQNCPSLLPPPNGLLLLFQESGRVI